MNIFILNRLCFKMAYSDELKESLLLIRKTWQLLTFQSSINTLEISWGNLTDRTTRLEWKFLCVIIV